MRKLFISEMLISLISLWALQGFAEDFPFSSSGNTAEELEKGLSANEGLKEKDKESLNADKVVLGGSLRNDLAVQQLENAAQEDFLQNPTILSLYLDSKLAGDIRGFFRGRLSYDGTVETGALSPLTGSTLNPSQSVLEELKLQIPIENKVFVTMGIQKIKWGSGHFWNPTDFLNHQYRNILDTVDRRSGLNLIKFHIPWKQANLYSILDLDQTQSQTRNVGGALRLELPFSTSWLSGEMALSQFAKKGQATLFGADFSFGLGPLDLIVELAGSKESQSRSSVLGVGYDWQYSDQDLVNFTLEFYNNESGAKSTNDYGSLILTQKFIPFHVANKYSLLSVYLPKPGNWDHFDFNLILIQNSLDLSQYSRIGMVWTGYTDLNFSIYLGQRQGRDFSEMRLGGLSTDYLVRTEIKF